MSVNFNHKIFVAGHKGMVGSAIVKNLYAKGYKNIITCTRLELDLTNQSKVKAFFKHEKPDQVYLAAAKVGGIHANNVFPAEFIYQNLMIEANVIHQAFISGVRKLIFLGSSCIYPKLAPQPMTEDMLLTGKLEPTNEPYAIAKIAGIKLCESYNRQYGQSHGIDYRCVMPTNLYGPGDHYHPENSHVIPALIRKFHEAKVSGASEVVIWGTGTQKREFLFVDDLASAAIFVSNLDKATFNMNTEIRQNFINVGFGNDLSIADLSYLIKDTVGYEGRVRFDKSRSDGAPRKLVDSSKIRNMGWAPKVNLKDGLKITYQNFIQIFN